MSHPALNPAALSWDAVEVPLPLVHGLGALRGLGLAARERAQHRAEARGRELRLAVQEPAQRRRRQGFLVPGQDANETSTESAARADTP